MAFVRTDLALWAYADGYSLWHYATNDTAAVVDSSGYFNVAAADLRVGDFIFGHVDIDGTPGFGIFTVSSNTGSVVDVSDMVSLAVADTD